jgi:hypothetical protein
MSVEENVRRKCITNVIEYTKFNFLCIDLHFIRVKEIFITILHLQKSRNNQQQ